MNNAERITEIKNRLSPLNPTSIEVTDESHKHIGHVGAKDGRGHFALTIQADCLNDISRIQQHQMIYQALGDLMETDIHALSIRVT